MRNGQTSKYTKVIGVSLENYQYILAKKYKKSIAGKLDEIIEYYKKYGENIKRTK